MPEIIPIFKSHYSIGKSILTLEKKGISKETEPNSIIDICLENNIKDLYLVEDGFSSFMEASINCKESNIKLIFGLRITICSDMNQKSEDEIFKSSKYIIFIKNLNGYKRLIKLFALANREGFYYEPRLDFNTLANNWSDKDLLLAVPFYDSFIHNNYFKGHLCVPIFNDIKPTFFIEKNDLPFDESLSSRVMQYSKDNYEVKFSKSIFYNKKSDFLTFLTFKCINNRSKLSEPQMEHFCSDEFCFESFLDQSKLK